MFHKKAKTTKKIVLRLECTVCKYKAQLPIKRCKHFELGGDKSKFRFILGIGIICVLFIRTWYNTIRYRLYFYIILWLISSFRDQGSSSQLLSIYSDNLNKAILSSSHQRYVLFIKLLLSCFLTLGIFEVHELRFEWIASNLLLDRDDLKFRLLSDCLK